MLTTVDWVEEETRDVNLADQRLNQRLSRILDQLGKRPNQSIPAATGAENEMMAAYRFFDNQKTGFGNVLQPHCDASSRRMAQEDVVILVPDTTEVDLTRPQQQVQGAGLLDGSRMGAFLHLLHGLTPDGTPLGTLWAQAWTREDVPEKKTSNRKRVPFEEKESFRWAEAFEAAREEAEATSQTQFVWVADSEADIYEVLEAGCESAGTLDFVIRACQDRAILLNEEEQEQKSEGAEILDRLRKRVEAAEVLFTETKVIRGREPKMANEKRKRRQAKTSRCCDLEVRAVQVPLRPPWRFDRKLQEITLNAVLVREVNPPEGEAAVEWLLITSLPIETEDQIRLVIQYYCVRWLIEVFFRTLKSGCRVEERRFEKIDRLLTCLGVYLIVTWRTLYVCRLGREFPELDCEAVFEPAEWKSVYVLVQKKPPPKKRPSLQEMVRLVGQLGGYVNRNRPDEPGPQTVWLGMQRLHDMAECWRAFGPESRQ